MFVGSERASRKRSMVVVKPFQHLSQASKLGGPRSSCGTHAPEATLKDRATWLSLRSARLPRGPNREKST
eukprot:4520278-Alexandrium_andersonii.AAC.1